MIKEKVQSAIADMSSKVGRNSKHVYVNNETGVKIQGVSTISSIVPKDWLAAWGAKEAVKALGYSDYKGDTAKAEEMLAKIKKIESPDKFIALLKEVKGASRRKSSQALVDGKEGHKWLEEYVEAKIKNISVPKVPTDNLKRPITQFLEWEKENVKEWVAAEAFICDIERGYAGQLDSIYISKDDKLVLGDFKFATFLGEDYYLQTAGYAAAFEQYGIQFDDRIIIRLPKTLEKEEYNLKTYTYSKIPNNIEVLTIPTKYKVDRDAFYAALKVKAWINYVKK